MVWTVSTRKGNSRVNDTSEKGRLLGLKYEMLGREAFLRTLCLERKRTERSGRRFVLMLLASDHLLKSGRQHEALDNVLIALACSTRDTDVKGWYEEGAIIGVIFTEVGDRDGKQVAHALLSKVAKAFSDTLTLDEIGDIRISLHPYPENWQKEGPDGPTDPLLYPDLAADRLGPVSRFLKRVVDVVSSLFALAVLSPVFLTVALTVKLTSPGPILFKQRRLGQYGRPFTFLKFRSMRATQDHQIHQKYVQSFISGKLGTNGSQAIFKITDDPRVTRVGKFLRRTSLDELPQFLNVLLGEMSLVGPRPPIQYEVACYDIWHRRRLLAVKPGITGLWQVAGRSQVSFDEMVRMDLTYATSWSLWLDARIVLQTPRAVLAGSGAY